MGRARAPLWGCCLSRPSPGSLLWGPGSSQSWSRACPGSRAAAQSLRRLPGSQRVTQGPLFPAAGRELEPACHCRCTNRSPRDMAPGQEDGGFLLAPCPGMALRCLPASSQLQAWQSPRSVGTMLSDIGIGFGCCSMEPGFGFNGPCGCLSTFVLVPMAAQDKQHHPHLQQTAWLRRDCQPRRPHGAGGEQQPWAPSGTRTRSRFPPAAMPNCTPLLEQGKAASGQTTAGPWNRTSGAVSRSEKRGGHPAHSIQGIKPMSCTEKA